MKTNEVLETIKARRSVRAYDRKQIPADDLNAILEAGAYAPSGIMKRGTLLPSVIR